MNTDQHDVKWEWEELEETDSTNRVAMERVLARWGAGQGAEGVVVVARRQTAGRGQHGRRWESPEGGLYVSAVLEDVPGELRERLALVVGVGVVEALELLGVRGLLIRWPNDVVVAVDGELKKVAGILCEAVAQGEKWAVVVGIGVNVAGDLPKGLAAASLAGLGVRVAPRRAAAAILPNLAAIPMAGLAEVVAQVRRRDSLCGKSIRFNDGARIWEGIGAGIDDAGRLLVQVNGGSVEAFARGSLVA